MYITYIGYVVSVKCVGTQSKHYVSLQPPADWKRHARSERSGNCSDKRNLKLEEQAN